MERYNLSDIEKRILKSLAEVPYKDGIFGDLSREELNEAAKHLTDYGLITHHIAGQGRILVFAKILDKGRVYLKENPVDGNMFKRVQWNKLIHCTINFVIKFKEFVYAIIALIGIAFWLLFLLKK